MAENKLLSLSEIFNQKIFRIPDFQRGYSWTEQQLNDFWEDLVNLKPDKVHYTGLLSVEEITRPQVEKLEKWNDDLWLLDSGMTAYYVIDGQQRLTTSIIFISVLLDNFNAEEGINFNTKEAWTNKFLYKQFGPKYKSFIFGYEKDNPSDEFFKNKILGQYTTTGDKVPDQTLYTANLKEAKTFFTKKLKDYDKAQQEELFRKLINKFKFNFYKIDDELDVYVTFETMNNRGKPLSNMELLKNRLIYISTLLPEDSQIIQRLRKDINEVWKTIYEYLGKNKDNPLNDDDFLFFHWIMYFKYDRNEAEAYAKFLLNEKFTIKSLINNTLKLSDIQNYIVSLSVSVKAYYDLYNIRKSDYSEEIKEWGEKLDRLKTTIFDPLLMAAMVKEKSEEKILTLFKACEKFIFLVFRVTQRPSNTKNSHFYRLANMYYFSSDYFGSGPTDIEKVIQDISYNTNGENNEGEYQGWFDLYKFQSYLKDQFTKDHGYYSWNGIKYFLYEYELHLMSKAKGEEKVSWADFDKRNKEVSIEHIFPQTDNLSCWKEAFADVPKKQRKILLHSLGNLVLLSKSKNSELQNKCFEFKKRHTNQQGDEVGFYNGSYSEIEVAGASNWTSQQIINRGKKMLEFLESRWGINLLEWEISHAQLLGVQEVQEIQG